MKEFLWNVISVCKYLLFLCCVILPFRPTVILAKITMVLILIILTYFLIIIIVETFKD